MAEGVDNRGMERADAVVVGEVGLERVRADAWELCELDHKAVCEGAGGVVVDGDGAAPESERSGGRLSDAAAGRGTSSTQFNVPHWLTYEQPVINASFPCRDSDIQADGEKDLRLFPSGRRGRVRQDFRQQVSHDFPPPLSRARLGATWQHLGPWVGRRLPDNLN